MVLDPKFRKELSRVRATSSRSASSASGMPAPNDHNQSNEHTSLLLSGWGSSRGPWYLDYENRFLRWPLQAFATTLKVIGSSYVQPLLVFLPFSLLASHLHWSPMVQFVLSFLSVISLSSLIDFSLEELSLYFGQWVSGLLNAIFGNTMEIIIGIATLTHDEFKFLQAILLGSILHNILFSIGCCFFVGGLWNREQEFNATIHWTMVTVMIFVLSSTTVPAIAVSIASRSDQKIYDITTLSHGSAIVLLLVYSAYLTFQLQTHTDLFDDENFQIEEEDEEEHVLGAWAAGITFVLTTSLTAICVQSILKNLDAVVEKTHMNKSFIGFVLVPFLSNASLDIISVVVALKSKMDLAIGAAISAGIQIVIFATPLLVILGWMMDRKLTLSFGILETVVVLLSSFVVLPVMYNGRATYLDGVLCLGLYVIVVMTISIFQDDDML